MKRVMIVAACAASALLAATATPSQAQTTTIGTGDATGEWWSLRSFEYHVDQSFRVPDEAVYLNSLSIYLEASPYWGSWYGSRLYLTSPTPGAEFRHVASLRNGGLNTFFFEALRVRPGDQLTFGIVSGIDWPRLWLEYPGQYTNGAPRFPYTAAVQVTRGNAYADGLLTDTDQRTDRGFDVRFEAEFTTTPEPASMALLAAGLAGVAGAARRRRRRTDAAG
jgi:hypothetical protein